MYKPVIALARLDTNLPLNDLLTVEIVVSKLSTENIQSILAPLLVVSEACVIEGDSIEEMLSLIPILVNTACSLRL
jgi:hypothetical protein